MSIVNEAPEGLAMVSFNLITFANNFKSKVIIGCKLKLMKQIYFGKATFKKL